MNQLKPAQRCANVRYAIRDIIVEAKKLIPTDMKILPLNIGDPNNFDFRPPEHIIKAVTKNIPEFSGYAPSEGLDEAREAIAEFQKKFNINNISKNDVLITTGGADAINLALNSICNRGDNILVPAPNYPAYEAQINFLECENRYYYLDENNDWQIKPKEIESLIDEKTKAIIIINPNNPTGKMLNQETLTQVLQIAKDKNLIVIADEQVYQYFVYEGEQKMCASLGIDVPIISIGSMSKSYFVPGWRIGWMVFHNFENYNDIKETIFKLKRVQIGSPHPLQLAIKPALTGDHQFLVEAVEKLKKRRDLLFEGINSIKGLSLIKPNSAFYAFIKIDLPFENDKQFVLELAKETGILVVNGSGLGEKEGSMYFRAVFLPQEEVLKEAIEKLDKFIISKF